MPEAAAPQTTPSSPAPASQSTPADASVAAAPVAASTPTPAPATTVPTPATPAARPDWAPESFWNKDKGEVDGAAFRKSFDELTAFKATTDSAKLTLPQKPEEYKVELSKNFKPPEGVEFALKADDPAIPRIQAFAHKHGLPQDAVNELADEYAGLMIGDTVAIKEAEKAQIASLGSAGQARAAAVNQWLAATMGEDTAKVFTQMPVIAKMVEGFEAVMKKMQSQGAQTFPQHHREGAGDPKKISNEEYEKLSMPERVAYARQFNQPASTRAA